jgi:hypothetical protein
MLIPKIPNIAFVVVGLLALLFVLSRPKQDVDYGGIGGSRTPRTLTITENDREGQLLTGAGGLEFVGGQTPRKTLLNSKCDCTTTPGQCCYTADVVVVQPNGTKSQQTIGPFCSNATCNEIKDKFLKDNAIELFANRVTIV